jgi:hypothetical protein
MQMEPHLSPSHYQDSSLLSKPSSFDEFLAYNQLRMQQTLQNPFFSMLKDPQDKILLSAKSRQTCLDALQVCSNFFQRMILLRQGTCYEKDFHAMFLDHLKEEFGHDELLAARVEKNEMKDALLHATSGWFSHQMIVLDNIEKAALVHLTLEMGGYYYHSWAKAKLDDEVDSDYFGIHSDADEDHGEMVLELLKNRTPSVYQRLANIVDQGWKMIDAMTGRVAFLAKTADENHEHEVEMQIEEAAFNFQQLLAHNQQRRQQFLGNDFFKMLQNGSLNDPKKKKLFLNLMAIWVKNNNFPFDNRYPEHQSYEFDAILESITDWFIHQTLVRNHCEKLAMMHLVLETVHDCYHKVVNSVLIPSDMQNFSHHFVFYKKTSFDPDLFLNQPPSELENIKLLIDTSWDLLETFTQHVHNLVNQTK